MIEPRSSRGVLHARNQILDPAGGHGSGHVLEGRGQLHENAGRRLRVEERDHPRDPPSWRLVKERHTPLLQTSELAPDLVGLEAEVMYPLPTALEEAGDTRAGNGWLQKLDLALARREQGDPDSLVRNRSEPGQGKAEAIAIKAQRVFEAPHDNPDVMNLGDHRLVIIG